MQPTELRQRAIVILASVEDDDGLAHIQFYLLRGIIYALLYIGAILTDKLDDINKSIKATIK
jgi:hypothetical protein